MTSETAAELRARLNALRASPDFDFEDALVDAWPAIDGMLTRLAASDENADRLAPVRCRGCGVSIHPATHVVLGNAWADDDGVFACASALTAHEPRPVVAPGESS